MSNTERFKLIPAVYLLLIKQGKVLLLRRYNTGYDDGNYSVPAGHMDGNEHPKSAVVREAYEEAGVVVRENQLEFAHVMHRITNDERVDFYFIAKEWEGEVKNMEPHKCDDLSWFELNDLPKNMNKAVKSAIESYNNKVVYSESTV